MNPTGTSTGRVRCLKAKKAGFEVASSISKTITAGPAHGSTARFDHMNVISLARFNSAPDACIPPLSDGKKHALEVFEKTCAELSLHMILALGDIQFLSNTHTCLSCTNSLHVLSTWGS